MLIVFLVFFCVEIYLWIERKDINFLVNWSLGCLEWNKLSGEDQQDDTEKLFWDGNWVYIFYLSVRTFREFSKKFFSALTMILQKAQPKIIPPEDIKEKNYIWISKHKMSFIQQSPGNLFLFHLKIFHTKISLAH